MAIPHGVTAARIQNGGLSPKFFGAGRAGTGRLPVGATDGLEKSVLSKLLASRQKGRAGRPCHPGKFNVSALISRRLEQKRPFFAPFLTLNHLDFSVLTKKMAKKYFRNVTAGHRLQGKSEESAPAIAASRDRHAGRVVPLGTAWCRLVPDNFFLRTRFGEILENSGPSGQAPASVRLVVRDGRQPRRIISACHRVAKPG